MEILLLSEEEEAPHLAHLSAHQVRNNNTRVAALSEAPQTDRQTDRGTYRGTGRQTVFLHRAADTAG